MKIDVAAIARPYSSASDKHSPLLLVVEPKIAFLLPRRVSALFLMLSVEPVDEGVFGLVIPLNLEGDMIILLLLLLLLLVALVEEIPLVLLGPKLFIVRGDILFFRASDGGGGGGGGLEPSEVLGVLPLPLGDEHSSLLALALMRASSGVSLTGAMAFVLVVFFHAIYRYCFAKCENPSICVGF